MIRARPAARAPRVGKGRKSLDETESALEALAGSWAHAATRRAKAATSPDGAGADGGGGDPRESGAGARADAASKNK